MKGCVTKKNNAWYVVLDFGKDETGKRDRKWLSARKELNLPKPATKKQAEELLVTKLREMQQGLYFEPTEVTVGQFLTHWLEDYGRANLRQKTWESYEGIIRLHIVPTLGGLLLKHLKPAHMQKLYTEKLNTLSTRSVRYIHSIMTRALKIAVQWEYLPRSIMEAVTPPALKQESPQPWDFDQVAKFFEVASQHRMWALWQMYITTGLRRGEMLGLKWSDVNLEEGYIQINRSLVVTSEGPTIQEPKTKKSRRTVAISESDVEVLREHRIQQLQELMASGNRNPDDWVFLTEEGTHYSPMCINRLFYRLTKKAGLERITLHTLRHTHATLALDSGVSLKHLSDRLGHSGIQITGDIYGHVLPEGQRQVATALEAKLFNKSSTKSSTTAHKK